MYPSFCRAFITVRTRTHLYACVYICALAYIPIRTRRQLLRRRTHGYDLVQRRTQSYILVRACTHQYSAHKEKHACTPFRTQIQRYANVHTGRKGYIPVHMTDTHACAGVHTGKNAFTPIGTGSQRYARQHTGTQAYIPPHPRVHVRSQMYVCSHHCWRENTSPHTFVRVTAHV